MNIASIVGARPQFIKAYVTGREWENLSSRPPLLIHTGQHYDYNMSRIFFEELGLSPPDEHLEIGSHSHGAQTGRMLEAIEGVLIREEVDLLLVYGDTNSTIAGALAGAKLNIPVGHVEAGMRSFNRSMPEEINRILTDHASDYLFASTTKAVENLHKEGIEEEKVHLVGDVMYDGALLFGDRAEETSTILRDLDLNEGEYLLATVHRAENTDSPERLKNIVAAFAKIASTHPLVLPLHPRTDKILRERGMMEALQAPFLQVIEPVGYLDMLQLEKHSRLVLTDSGGVQKEAFFFRRPCVTLRDETEWVELVETGWNFLLSPKDAGAIVGKVEDILENDLRGREVQLYGEGQAGRRIAEILLAALRSS